MVGIIKRPDGDDRSKPSLREQNPDSALTPMAKKLSGLARPSSIGSRLPAVGGQGELYAAFACDTTGSMFRWFDEAKRAIGRIASEVWQRQKGFRLAFVPYKNHRDEGCFDGHHPFSSTGFTNELERIDQRLASVRREGGGNDGLCALEDVFHFLNTDADWPRLAKKMLVVIGDMPPHGLLDAVSVCPNEFDYRVEVEKFKEKKIPVYPVYCHDENNLVSARSNKVAEFYRWLAAETGGKCLPLADIDDLVQVLIGACLKETGHLPDYVAQLRKAGRFVGQTEKNLLLLGGGK